MVWRKEVLYIGPRCTGYRPILDTFKAFASDATKELKDKVFSTIISDQLWGLKLYS